MILDVSEICTGLDPVIRLIKLGVIPIIQFGIPIILIILGSIDLGKSVVSSDDKKIKEAQGMLVKRAIAAIAVFFVTTLVMLVFNIFASTAGESTSGDESTNAGDSWIDCWNDVA